MRKRGTDLSQEEGDTSEALCLPGPVAGVTDRKAGLKVCVRTVREQSLGEDPSVEQSHALRVLPGPEDLRGLHDVEYTEPKVFPQVGVGKHACKISLLFIKKKK